jgi:hypothetical protein
MQLDLIRQQIGRKLIAFGASAGMFSVGDANTACCRKESAHRLTDHQQQSSIPEDDNVPICAM